ncbi:hypothetical protein COB11_00575 [Candidatus Aerophobetes bacterium]|uniref:Major facilitator superfamily (MFS) profile domain-containing protein n=1 Tax=Aerophobetes bacterium TaxID=2030807 RepID=A0A2A4YMG3_UNCAE|nr:MAG: hypothetical protein COB11_00575 [Candidatus Aerophobetes bacterium]
MATLKQIFNWETPGLLEIESSLRHWLLLANIILSNVVIVISAVGTAIPMNEIQGYMAVNATKIDWVESGFLLALGVAVPLSIFFSRKFGFKRLFFVGIALFVVGSFIGGISTNYYMLISARIVAGMGGGVIFPVSLTVIRRLFKGNALKIAVTIYVAMTFGVGLGLGCIIGGFFGQLYAWRTVFLLGVYVGIPCLLFTWILMKETGVYPTPKFDYISFIFFALFLISTLFYLTQVKAPWNTLGFRSNFSIGCMIVSVGFLSAFLRRYKMSKSPLFALSIFRRKEFTICCIAMAFVGVMIFGSSVSFINLLIEMYEYERNVVGIVVSMFGFCFGLGGLIPIILGKWVKIHFFAIAGLMLVAVSCFVNHSLTLQSTPEDILLILIIRALGTSLALGPLTAISLQNMPDDLAGQASAIVTIFRQVGGAYGTALISIFSTVRFPYHLTRFAEMVNTNSAAYQDYIARYTNRIIGTTGTPDVLAEKYSNGYVMANISKQAYIASFDDAFFIFGWMFVSLTILMIYLAFSKEQKIPLPKRS